MLCINKTIALDYKPKKEEDLILILKLLYSENASTNNSLLRAFIDRHLETVDYQVIKRFIEENQK